MCSWHVVQEICKMKSKIVRVEDEIKTQTEPYLIVHRKALSCSVAEVWFTPVLTCNLRTENQNQ